MAESNVCPERDSSADGVSLKSSLPESTRSAMSVSEGVSASTSVDASIVC